MVKHLGVLAMSGELKGLIYLRNYIIKKILIRVRLCKKNDYFYFEKIDLNGKILIMIKSKLLINKVKF